MKDKLLWAFVTLLTFSSLSLFTSCSNDDEVEASPTTEPHTNPDESSADKDLSVNPGDSFFDYCNGTWLKNNPIPEDPRMNIGRLYSAREAMDKREEELEKDNPDIGRFFMLMKHMHDYSKESNEYIDAQAELIKQIKKPDSKEEAYRTIGKMYMDGINVLGMRTLLVWDGKIQKLALVPKQVTTPTQQLIEELKSQESHSLATTRAGGGQSALTLLAEGMGIAPAMLNMSNTEIQRWNSFWEQYSVDELYQMMQSYWQSEKMYADEAGLAEYNKTLPEKEQMKIENLRDNARLELNYVMSYYLQQKYVPQQLKDKYLNITKEIKASLRKRIERVDWMSETTKNNAIEKLDFCRLNVAFPDTWYKEYIPTLTDCKTMIEALHRLRAANARLKVKLVGTDDTFTYNLLGSLKVASGRRSPLDLTLVNAYYNLPDNSITIYPAMLMPPYMPSDNVSEAYYWAGFSTIGHELTHAFDSNGSQWDKYGKLKNWWTVADRMNFEDRSANLVRTYNLLELDPVREPLTFCNGTRTINENIADLGGFLTALDAFQARLDQQGLTGEARNAQIRMFYEEYARQWRVQYGQNRFDIFKNSDVHAPARLRVDGVVMNTDPWYDLYNVNKNHVLYLPEERRAKIW